MKDFQKQVRKIIEERGYKLRDFLLPLFDGTDKTGKVDAEIWPTWEKYPAVKVANVVVELRKIIPIHEEFMDWTGDGEEYDLPNPGMSKRYAEAIKAIEHLSGLLPGFIEGEGNAAFFQDAMIGEIALGSESNSGLLSAKVHLKELQSTLEMSRLLFNVASMGRQCRLPYRKGQDGIYKTMRMEAARRITELQTAVLGKPLFDVAAAIATVLVMPHVCDATVDPDSLKVKAHRKKT